MASLFRDRTLGHSKRDSFSSSSSSITISAASPSSATSRFTYPANSAALTPLTFPFGDLTPTVSDSDLRATAYEIFVSANRSSSSSSKPFTYIASNGHTDSPNSSSSNGGSNSNLQRSLTSAAASKMKKALG